MEKNENKTHDSSNREDQAGNETQKSKVHIIVEIIEYMPNAVVSKTIIKKTSGNVTITSFAADEELAEKKSPYDTYIQIIDGAAEVIINEKKYQLKAGDGIVVPVNAPYSINAHEKFKMISTVIKSEADD
jgi:quercetin dioxygenase-like cupin family protein